MQRVPVPVFFVATLYISPVNANTPGLNHSRSMVTLAIFMPIRISVPEDSQTSSKEEVAVVFFCFLKPL